MATRLLRGIPRRPVRCHRLRTRPAPPSRKAQPHRAVGARSRLTRRRCSPPKADFPRVSCPGLQSGADLPEGEVVYLQPMAGIVADEGDDLDDEERAALHADMEASIAEADRGETEDFGSVIAELR